MNSIVILESEWDNDLNTTESVIPVFELFAKHNEVCICHKHYHSNKELLKWINDYINHKDHDICYIAGHGSGKRLEGLFKDINIGKLAENIPQEKKRKVRKGLYFGTCDSGKYINELFDRCYPAISWLAGYTKIVPWFESTMIDILFLEYFMFGACRKIKNGDSFEFKNDSIEIDNSTIRSVRRTYARLLEDVKLAQLCGLVVRSNKNQNLLI